MNIQLFVFPVFISLLLLISYRVISWGAFSQLLIIYDFHYNLTAVYDYCWLHIGTADKILTTNRHLMLTKSFYCSAGGTEIACLFGHSLKGMWCTAQWARQFDNVCFVRQGQPSVRLLLSGPWSFRVAPLHPSTHPPGSENNSCHLQCCLKHRMPEVKVLWQNLTLLFNTQQDWKAQVGSSVFLRLIRAPRTSDISSESKCSRTPLNVLINHSSVVLAPHVVNVAVGNGHFTNDFIMLF